MQGFGEIQSLFLFAKNTRAVMKGGMHCKRSGNLRCKFHMKTAEDNIKKEYLKSMVEEMAIIIWKNCHEKNIKQCLLGNYYQVYHTYRR